MLPSYLPAVSVILNIKIINHPFQAPLSSELMLSKNLRFDARTTPGNTIKVNKNTQKIVSKYHLAYLILFLSMMRKSYIYVGGFWNLGISISFWYVSREL